MTNEIKEIIKFQDILNYYKAKQIEPTYCEELITTGELQSLLDCITNLQEENERLNNVINKLEKLIEQYSKNDYYYKYDGKYLKSEIIKDLSDILKGEENE